MGVSPYVRQASDDAVKVLLSPTGAIVGALGVPEMEASGLITAVHDQPSYVAFQHLAAQRVASALVWNPSSSSWAGFLDLGDYAKHVGTAWSGGG